MHVYLKDSCKPKFAVIQSLFIFHINLFFLRFSICRINLKVIMKFFFVILFCFLFVLQVCSEDAFQPKLTCASMCEQVEFGNAGICCSKTNPKNRNKQLFKVITGHDYCDCGSGSNIPRQCPTDEVFCDKGNYQKLNVTNNTIFFLKPQDSTAC